MGHEFMKKWKLEAKERGFKLSLSTWRNARWRDDRELAASMYRLLIVGDPERPRRAEMVQLFSEFAHAARRHVPVASTVPWEEIVGHWDREDRSTSNTM